VVGLSDPCGVGLSQYENVCGANRYSVGWCGLKCHSVQRGGGAIVKVPHYLRSKLLWRDVSIKNLSYDFEGFVNKTEISVVLSIPDEKIAET
jgi:hypothetical protein